MKLLILDNQPIRRGAQMFAQHFKEHLNNSGHHCRRVFLYDTAGESSVLPLDEHDVLLDGKKNNYLEVFPSVQPSLCRKLASEITEYKPDIVLLNGARAVKYGGITKWRYYRGKTPFVVRIIDSVAYWNTSAIRQWYSRNVITPRIDGAVGVGEKALQDYRNLYGFKGPGTAIPRAFDFNGFRQAESREQVRNRLGTDNSEKIVLFLGNITEQKRPDRFLKVFSRVCAVVPEAKAWIVGDGALRKKIAGIAQELGIGDKVTFWGYQSDVEPFITASDLLFISSDTEGVPGIALEAQYLEKPVVTTNAGDVEMVVRNGVSGYVCGKEDEEGLTNRITELLTHPELAAKMGKEGKDHVSSNFNLADITERYLSFFRSVIDKKNQTAV